MANHFKFIQVPVVFLLKLQNEEARMEAAFLALPYLVLVLVFLLQLLCRNTSRKRPRPTEVLYVSRQMELLCDMDDMGSIFGMFTSSHHSKLKPGNCDTTMDERYERGSQFLKITDAFRRIQEFT